MEKQVQGPSPHVGEGREVKSHKSMDPRTCEKFKFNKKSKWAEVEEQGEGRQGAVGTIRELATLRSIRSPLTMVQTRPVKFLTKTARGLALLRHRAREGLSEARSYSDYIVPLI